MSRIIDVKFKTNYWPSNNTTCIALAEMKLENIAKIFNVPIFRDADVLGVIVFFEQIGFVSFVNENEGDFVAEVHWDIGLDTSSTLCELRNLLPNEIILNVLNENI